MSDLLPLAFEGDQTDEDEISSSESETSDDEDWPDDEGPSGDGNSGAGPGSGSGRHSGPGPGAGQSDGYPGPSNTSNAQQQHQQCLHDRMSWDRFQWHGQSGSSAQTEGIPRIVSLPFRIRAPADVKEAKVDTEKGRLTA